MAKKKLVKMIGTDKGLPPINLPIPPAVEPSASSPLGTATPPVHHPMRQILIETDGDNIRLLKAEVGGKIELIGIFESLIAYLKSKPTI